MSKSIRAKAPKQSEKQPHKNRKMKKSIRWGALLVVFLICFGAYNFIQEYYNYLDLKGEVTYYQSQLASVEQTYTVLQNEKSLLFDDSYLEKMAREDLGMIKSGETLVLPMERSDFTTNGNGQVSNEDIH